MVNLHLFIVYHKLFHLVCEKLQFKRDVQNLSPRPGAGEESVALNGTPPIHIARGGFGHLAESLFRATRADSELYPTLTADQLTHAESRGRGGGGGGCGGRLVERALPVGHVQQAGLGGGWPRLTLLQDTRTHRVRHTSCRRTADGVQHQSLRSARSTSSQIITPAC